MSTLTLPPSLVLALFELGLVDVIRVGTAVVLFKSRSPRHTPIGQADPECREVLKHPATHSDEDRSRLKEGGERLGNKHGGH